WSGNTVTELPEVFSICNSICSNPPSLSSTGSPSSCPDNMYEAFWISASITSSSPLLLSSSACSLSPVIIPQAASIDKSSVETNNKPIFFTSRTSSFYFSQSNHNHTFPIL